MIQYHIDKGRYHRNTVRKYEIPLLKATNMLSIVAIEEDQKDIGGHAQHLSQVSNVFVYCGDVIPRVSLPS